MTSTNVTSLVVHQLSKGPIATSLHAVRNPFQAIRNVFRKPQVSANFPVNGKKVKLSAEEIEELSRKYGDIDDVGDLAFEVIKDLKLVDTKWRNFPKKKG
jgi:hypothetical protein